jgi:hypothetical protein
MRCAIVFLALGIQLVLPQAGPSARASFPQETGTPSQQPDQTGQDTTTATDSVNKTTKPPKDAKPKKGNPSKTAKKDETAASGKSGLSNEDAATDAGAGDKKAKSAGQPSFQDLAKENLRSFDAAIDLAQRLGVVAPAVWQGRTTGDSFAAKRYALQERADGAKNEQAWAAVAAEVATALKDLLKAIAATTDYSTGTTKTVPLPEVGARTVTDTPDLKASFWRSYLALYLAGLSLLASAVGLWRGWFVARRETNKALVEAGLL